jgi:predicted O-linked N-acetylglucosamine transferase (SPINDLY family)
MLHGANNRLQAFARKPAPIQVTYLGYCSTTGLDAMDYRFSDPYFDPPGSPDEFYSEQTVRLPESYWCYEPVVELQPNDLPALQNGYVTFGSLNTFSKLSPPTLAAWCRILRMVPDSRLLINAPDGSTRERIRDLFSEEGINPKRLRFTGTLPIRDYFELYHQVDLALDSFPRGGGTTVCDALWMGVPVVTLAGATALSRAGLSILSNAGLPELVARDTAEYVGIAASIAKDLPRLESLRATLRPKLEQSPLMDAKRFTRGVEAAYRSMWQAWLDSSFQASQKGDRALIPEGQQQVR